ncbi:hypothetical protein L596_011513 [Steinernema carpocapsae]|uniref:Uncharacterized protein n=1 Tax=Steinernema carpocapsae TaxID=34508 RepID=A0A4U5NUJ3_STECR|nr:hypothetical protein L596_011513 [Steinernema carpocapsae]
MALKAAPARADKLVLNEGSSSSSEDEEVQEHYSSDEKGELSASSGDEVEAPGKEFDHGVDMDNDEDFEVVSFEERQRKAQELPRRQLTKKIEETKNSHKMALAKPNLVKDRERERHLSRIATKVWYSCSTPSASAKAKWTNFSRTGRAESVKRPRRWTN